jgi:hypothetical protein
MVTDENARATWEVDERNGKMILGQSCEKAVRTLDSSFEITSDQQVLRATEPIAGSSFFQRLTQYCMPTTGESDFRLAW